MLGICNIYNIFDWICIICCGHRYDIHRYIVHHCPMALDVCQAERRRAPDGRWYTRDEFIKLENPGVDSSLDSSTWSQTWSHKLQGCMETQRFTRFKSCFMLRFFGKKAGESNWKWASRT